MMTGPWEDQLGTAYDDYGPVQRQRHWELLASVGEAGDVAFWAERREQGRWEVTIAARDHLGVLSLIAGLLTSLRIDIIRCDAFTLILPSEGGEAVGRILNIFEVSAPAIQDQQGWKEVRQALADLIRLTAAGCEEQAHEEVVDRVSAVMGSLSESYEPLMPIEITFDNDSSLDCTALHVSSVVTPGFLFAFTHALALLEIDIHRARILTEDSQANDTFWVRDALGQKIESAARLQQLRTASVLIKQFAYLLPLSADPNQALRQFRQLVKVMLRAGVIDDLHSVDAMRTLARFMGVSRHLWEDFLRMQHEHLFPLVADPARLESHRNRAELRRSLQDELAVCQGDEEQTECLNRFKDREIFRTDLRHITGRIDNITFTRQISNIAEIVIGQAVELCYERLARRWGQPLLEPGTPCPWSVLALGKCGAREMGYASDIELMLVYQGAGQTSGSPGTTTQRFYIDLMCLLLEVLKVPKEGIFEIDLRLRPYGKDGSLASSLNAFRRYYDPAGPARQFERMALVKLRPIAGDAALGAEVLRVRDVFVYSGAPLDSDNIIHLRQRQATELVPSGVLNTKYSPGGLVDLEYYVQANQIERGAGREALHTTGTLEALDQLQALGYLDQALAGHFRQAYTLIRRIIDALRVVRGNARDLSLPAPDSRAFFYLVRRLHYDDVATLQRELYHAMALGRALWSKRARGGDWSVLTERTLLVCTDTHARMCLPQIDCPQALAWLHGGDFYQGSDQRVMGHHAFKSHHAKKRNLDRWLNQQALPVYAVRGNHDVADHWGFFAADRDISGRVQRLSEDLFVAGVGWSGEEFHQLPTAETLESLCRDLDRDIHAQVPPVAALIVLSHYPADTSLCPGFAGINAFLQQWRPVVFIQGHIHEAFAKQSFLVWPDGTQTLVVNPGPQGGTLTVLPEAGTALFKAGQ